MQGLPQQQQPEQTERERRMAQMQAMQQAAVTRQGAPVAPQQPSQPLTNNYQGPPEAPVQVEPQRAGPTGFVGFGQQLAANQDVARQMGNAAGNAAMDGGGLANLRNDAGRTALLQRAYGKAAQVTDMDAALAGGGGANYFAQLQSDYSPEAVARKQAQQQRDAQAQRQFNEQTAAVDAKNRQRQDEMQRAAAVPNEVARLRAIDANRPRGQMTAERWANLHGMTLEQWVQGGKKPAY